MVIKYKGYKRHFVEVFNNNLDNVCDWFNKLIFYSHYKGNTCTRKKIKSK